MGKKSGARAATRAAETQNEANRRAIEESQRQFGLSREFFLEERGRFDVRQTELDRLEQERFDIGLGREDVRLSLSDRARAQFTGEEQRRFEERQGALDPFLQAGGGAIGDLATGATPGGFASNLEQILGGDAFRGLVEERQRALQGQLSAGGLTRSGTALEEASALPVDLALRIEQQLAGRQQGLAQAGLSAAGATGGTPGFVGVTGARGVGGPGTGVDVGRAFGGDQSNIVGLLQQQGATTAQGILGAQQASAARSKSIGKTALGVAKVALSFFSDPQLKENAEQVAIYGDVGIYQWDWIPEVHDMIVSRGPQIGFMADEIEKKYPQYVGEWGGFKMIDYSGLMDELDQKLAA